MTHTPYTQRASLLGSSEMPNQTGAVCFMLESQAQYALKARPTRTKFPEVQVAFRIWVIDGCLQEAYIARPYNGKESRKLARASVLEEREEASLDEIFASVLRQPK